MLRTLTKPFSGIETLRAPERDLGQGKEGGITPPSALISDARKGFPLGLAGCLIDLPFPLEILVVGQIAGRLFDATLQS
jgi:hypothetical protein